MFLQTDTDSWDVGDYQAKEKAAVAPGLGLLRAERGAL